MKVKSIITGEIIDVIKVSDNKTHSLATPERPVWVDETNYLIGLAVGKYSNCPHGYVRVGSPEDKLFIFNLENERKLHTFLETVNPNNPLAWPSETEKPTFPGCPKYHLQRVFSRKGKALLMIIFQEPVILSQGEISKRFIVWHKPGMITVNSGFEHIHNI